MKHYLILITITLLLTACGKPKAPTGQQVLNYFNGHLPAAAPLQFADPTLETYPEGEGRCRVKYKITVKLIEDMLSPVSPTEAMKSAGWDSATYADSVSQLTSIDEPFKSSVPVNNPAGLNQLKIAKVVSKAGTEAQLLGTLEAERQADDSWTFTAIEGGNMTQTIPGQFSLSHAPGHYLAVDSDEAKKAVNEEIDREKAFVAAATTAKQQSDAARLTQNQQKADEHAALVKQLLDMTSAGKRYLGTLTSTKGSTQIILVFDTQSNGGGSVSAHFENPTDPTQIRSLNGALVLEKDEYPVHLRGTGAHILKPLSDHLLTQWLGELSLPFKLKPTPAGELVGAGYETQMVFKAEGAGTTNTPAVTTQ